MITSRARATLVALPLLGVLIGLGCWQLHRLAWKEDLLARLQTGLDSPAQLYAGQKVEEFQLVRVEGHLLADQPLYLYARTKDGVAGVHVFALLERNGPPLVVDRGFLPLPVNPELATALASQSITGVVRRQSHKLWYEPANDPARNEWYWPDLPAMAATAHLEEPLDFFIEATEPASSKGPEPTGQLILSHIRNDHLQYALTWFTLAGVLLIIWGLSLRTNRNALL